MLSQIFFYVHGINQNFFWRGGAPAKKFRYPHPHPHSTHVPSGPLQNLARAVILIRNQIDERIEFPLSLFLLGDQLVINLVADDDAANLVDH